MSRVYPSSFIGSKKDNGDEIYDICYNVSIASCICICVCIIILIALNYAIEDIQNNNSLSS
tara:strand:+ start:123 stop:305 length:183 start_codon:yes stop_codon:yes gene_type:complete